MVWVKIQNMLISYETVGMLFKNLPPYSSAEWKK